MMSNKMSEVTKAMQYELLRIIKKPLELIEEQHDRDNPIPEPSDWSKAIERQFKEYIEKANKFFHEQGCETRTSHFILKSYYPKKGSWKFTSRRTRGLIWLQYDEDRFRCKAHSIERYWVGIPEELALKILKTKNFPTYQ